MCGLMGWWFPEGKRPFNDLKAEVLFRALSINALPRGDDSYGVAFGHAGENAVLVKEVAPISKLMVDGIGSIAQATIVIGHTRAASKGAVKIENAHPFLVGGYIMAHNGHIGNADVLAKGAKHIPVGDTDSEMALCHLVSKGFSKESFEELSGSWALTIASENLKEFYLVRDSSPLSFARVGKGDEEGIIWHSTTLGLEEALAMAGIEAEVHDLAERVLGTMHTGSNVELAKEKAWKGYSSWYHNGNYIYGASENSPNAEKKSTGSHLSGTNGTRKQDPFKDGWTYDAKTGAWISPDKSKGSIMVMTPIVDDDPGEPGVDTHERMCHCDDCPYCVSWNIECHSNLRADGCC